MKCVILACVFWWLLQCWSNNHIYFMHIFDKPFFRLISNFKCCIVCLKRCNVYLIMSAFQSLIFNPNSRRNFPAQSPSHIQIFNIPTPCPIQFFIPISIYYYYYGTLTKLKIWRRNWWPKSIGFKATIVCWRLPGPHF